MKTHNSLLAFALVSLVFLITSCGGGSSSNNRDRVKPNQECSDDFGDASRCNIRESF